jgi:hypothetical protein
VIDALGVLLLAVVVFRPSGPTGFFISERERLGQPVCQCSERKNVKKSRMLEAAVSHTRAPGGNPV